MQITISDHETHTGPKSDKDVPFRWWVSFTVGNEAAFNFSRQLVCSFSDFAEYLVAKGEFDGYNDTGNDGQVFMYNTDPITGIPYGRVNSWTYNQVIREFLLAGDLENCLADFIAIKLAEAEVIEDLVLKTNAA